MSPLAIEAPKFNWVDRCEMGLTITLAFPSSAMVAVLSVLPPSLTIISKCVLDLFEFSNESKTGSFLASFSVGIIMEIFMGVAIE